MEKKTLTIIKIILLIVALFALESAVIMMLWNWIVVGLFNVAPIDFGIGCGIVFVINLAYGLFID